ncbi:MAG: hypothetical protein WCJ64_00560 [Rhodospirillaceae bacterium]
MAAADTLRRIKGAQKEALGILPLGDPRSAPICRMLIEQRGSDPFELAEATKRYGKDIGFHPSFHPSEKNRFISWPALCAVLRDSTGQITAVQGTRVDLETCRAVKRDGKTVRLTRGVMTDAAIRLPGIAPGWLKPILVDGLDKGIISNLATGRPVLVCCGSLARLVEGMPDGSAFTISQDHDFKEPGAGKKSPQELLDETCAAAHARGCRVSLISPAVRYAPDGETRLKTDWDDVAVKAGFPQVAIEISASLKRWLPPDHPAMTHDQQHKADAFADALEELSNQEALSLPLGEAALATVADQIVEAMAEIARRKAAVADLQAVKDATFADYKTAVAHRKTFRGIKGKDATAGRAAARDASKDALAAAKAAKLAHQAAADTLAADIKTMAWVRLINATLGSGKSRMIGAIISRLPPTLSIGVAVADRSRIDETAASLKGVLIHPHRVLPILGREQHLDGTPMCPKADIANDIQKNGKSIQSKLCKATIIGEDGERTCELCPFFEDCRYQKQMADKEPAVRVFAHNYISLTNGSPLPPFDLIFIDEDFTKSLTHKGEYTVPLAGITEVDWIINAMLARENKPKSKAHARTSFERLAGDEADIREYTKRLFGVLNDPDPTPAKLISANITAASAKYMADMWYAAVDDLDITPAMPEELQRKTLKDYQCGVGYKCARLWRIVQHTLETPELAAQSCIPGLDIVTAITGKGADVREEKIVHMLWSTVPNLDCPVVILDGTANRHKAGQFYSGLTETTIKIAPQHTKIVQIIDRPLSKSSLGYGLGKGEYLKNPREDEKTRAKNQRAKAARLFEVLATKATQSAGLNPLGKPWAKVAVVAQMDIGEAIRSEHPYLGDMGVSLGYEREDGKWTCHHGAARGSNVYEMTPVIVPLGRNIPPRECLEREARAIWSNDPAPWQLLGPGKWEKKTAWIRVKGEGKCPVQNPWHPDYRVRILLDQYLRAELEQEIHRVRPIRRTADNPCTIYICTDIATSLEVDDVTTWADLVPDEAALMVSRGIIPSDWFGRSKVLADLFMTAKVDGDDEISVPISNPAAALKNRAYYDADLAASFAQASNPTSVRKPNNLPIIGTSDGSDGTTPSATYTPFRYRILGREKGGYLLIDNRHGDPLAAAQERLGPLDRLIEITWDQYLSAMAEPPAPDEDLPDADATPEPPSDWEAASAVPDEAFVGFIVDFADPGRPDPFPD